MPKVSIIVPVYGVERYIERCVVSLFEQTYEDIEYIFVNDATPDKSIEVLTQVLQRYPLREKQVNVIAHQKNKGLSAARTTGIAASTGEYVMHVDSDDYVALNAIEHLVNKADAERADIVVFDTYTITAKGLKKSVVVYDNKESYIKRMLQHTEKCAHWNKFYRGDFYRNSGIKSDERIRMAEDYAVTPRLAYLANTISVLHEPLYYYETTNQNSYLNNLSRSAIESHRLADGILQTFFSNKAEYADIIASLSQRSLVSLMKNTNVDGWKVILDVYKDTLQLSGRKMTLVNRIIFQLAKRRNLKALQLFMNLYHFIMRDRR